MAEVRDVKADYIAAHLAEFESYKTAGLTERANAVAVVLRQLGVEVDKAPAGVKERAVAPEPVERAVEADAPPKRRPGRPKKTD